MTGTFAAASSSATRHASRPPAMTMRYLCGAAHASAALIWRASFAWTIQTQDSLLDLVFVGTEAYCFTAGRGVAHTEQILEILSAVRICADEGFETLSRAVFDRISGVSGCIVVLLAWDERRQAFVKYE